MQPKGLIVAVPLALAAALSLFIVSGTPSFGPRIVVGVALLLVAFVSTRLSLYLLVFSMLLSPEFLVAGLAGGGAAAGRGITLRFDDFLLVVIGVVWIAKMAILKGGTPFLRTPLNGPIMFFIAAAGLATLIGVLAGRVKPMTGFFFWLKYYEYVFLYFMVVSAVTTKEQARGLVIASLVTCFLVSLFAIAQIPSGGRASAPFEGSEGEPNTLGGYLVFMLAIVSGLLLIRGAVPNRLPLLLLLAVGAIGLMATLSRASFLAALVVFLVVVGLLSYRKPLLLALMLTGMLFSPWWAPEAVKERIMFTLTQAPEAGQIQLGGVRVDTSTSERIMSWQKSLQYFYQYPLWGGGVTGGPYFMDAMYPRVLVETGLLGTVFFAYLLWSLFRLGRTTYKESMDPFDRGLALGFLLGFVGLLVHAVGSNTFIIVRIMEPFWLFAALVARSRLITQVSDSTEATAESRLEALKGVGISPKPPAEAGAAAGWALPRVSTTVPTRFPYRAWRHESHDAQAQHPDLQERGARPRRYEPVGPPEHSQRASLGGLDPGKPDTVAMIRPVDAIHPDLGKIRGNQPIRHQSEPPSGLVRGWRAMLRWWRALQLKGLIVAVPRALARACSFVVTAPWHALQPKGLIVTVSLALAAALSLFIVSGYTSFGPPIVVGVALLLVALFSTRLSLYLLVFSMLLGPEFLFSGTLGGATAGRGITLRFDDFLLIVIGFAWLAKMALFKKGPPFTRTPLNGPIMLYIAAAVLATLIGVQAGRVKPMAGFFYLMKYYEYVFLYFMVVSAVTTKEQARGLVIASLVTCFLVSLFAIAQIPSGGRASAPFEGSEGEPNTLGGYLVFMLAIVSGLLLTRGAVPNRLPFLLLLAVGAIGLMATLSRASFLAALVVFLAVVGLLSYRKPLLLTLMLTGMLLSPWWAPEAVKERIMFTLTQAPEAGQIQLGGVRVDTSTSERIMSWQKSLQYFYRYPLWGGGVTGGPYFMDAMYPRVLVETGLLGTVFFAYLLWSLFRLGRATYKESMDPFDRGLALGFLLGFVGLLVHAVGANTFIIVRIMEPFWLVAALVARSHALTQIDHAAGNKLGAQQEAQAAEGVNKMGDPTLSPTARARPQWRQSAMGRTRRQ